MFLSVSSIQIIYYNRNFLYFCSHFRMASRVLCATLAVPIPAARNAIDTLLEMGEETAEKQRKLANMLMLQGQPKRQGLVQDLVCGFQ